VPAPRSTLVDASLGLVVRAHVAGAPNPKYGRPTVLAAPTARHARVARHGEGYVLALDRARAPSQPLCGPRTA
jgi:hypothetical protein